MNNREHLFRPFDLLIGLCLLGVTLATSLQLPSEFGHWAEVRENGHLLGRYRLDDPPQQFEIECKAGKFTLGIDEKGIRILKAPCLHKICIRTGAIKRSGRFIACAPSHLIVRISGDLESNVDAITR